MTFWIFMMWVIGAWIAGWCSCIAYERVTCASAKGKTDE